VARILVVDLEATCSDDGSIPPEEMEIIEIGACWTTEGGVVLERFQHLVKPLARPILTPFCKQLIGITQEEVDQAPLAPCRSQALQAFVNDMVSTDTCLDELGKLRSQATDQGRPASWDRHAFDHAPPECQATVCEGPAHRQGSGHGPSVRAERHQLEGQHHRGLDDAVNIAKLMPWVLGHATLSGRQASAVV
jgi:inhibitor of KinA sporulation pathway (predicted exonuclease)